MIKRFKEYFTYTNKERNGIIVLLILLVFLVSARVYQKSKSYGEITIMDEEFKNDILAFENSLEPKNTITFKKKNNSGRNNVAGNDHWQKSGNLFYFDPNKVTKTELKKLGFTKKQINTLANYREKGGEFFVKEDLLKIYGIEKEQFKYLEEYIQIERNNEDKEVKAKKNVEIKKLIDINTASETELKKLPGIGTSYASRIVKYRNLLGGFVSKEQLLEVYGIDSTR